MDHRVYHPLIKTATPVFGSRKEYIEKLIHIGFIPYMEGGTGLYLHHPSDEKRAVWVGWEIDGIFFVDTVTGDQ